MDKFRVYSCFKSLYTSYSWFYFAADFMHDLSDIVSNSRLKETFYRPHYDVTIFLRFFIVTYLDLKMFFYLRDVVFNHAVTYANTFVKAI